MTRGQELKALRHTTGLSQGAFAVVLGIRSAGTPAGQVTLSRWESDKPPPPEQILRHARLIAEKYVK
jgi:DNA-binding transcriptional regulator YiaG